MMLRCREIVELVASETGTRRPLMLRLRIGLHLAMCRHCTAYTRGLAALRNLSREVLAGSIMATPAQREQILAAVRREASVPNTI